MNDHMSYIGAHERGLRDLMDEGFELPVEGAVLTYRDRIRDRFVIQIYPNRAAAEARAEEALRAHRTRRGECRICSLEEAIV
ncbi:hypothetical protein ACFLQ0_03340 [Nitrospinota bacterium]